jgi:hypothetical protein
LAHEFAHILQFKEGAKDSREMETHADFMAGWAIAQLQRDQRDGKAVFTLQTMQDACGITGPTVGDGDRGHNRHNVGPFLPRSGKFGRAGFNMALESMFRLGDVLFDDPDHHGEPAYRRVLVRAGNEAGNLGVKEAFEKGMEWTGLERT